VKYARPPGEIVTGISLMAQGYRARHPRIILCY